MRPLNPVVFVYFTSTFFLALSLAEDKCGSNFKEGDKWFDGCNWCTCEKDGQKCTKAVCPSFDKNHPRQACNNPGESWRDGCFHCQCLPTGIRCKVNKRCVKSLRDIPTNCQKPSAVDPNLCICGLDGVPSCALESLSKVPDDSEDTSDNGVLLSKQQVKSNIKLNDEAIDNEYNDQPVPYIPIRGKKCYFGTRWYEGSERCYCDEESGVTCGNPRFIARRVDGYKVRRKKCKAGKQWVEKCRFCICRVPGLSFCRIDRKCTKNKKIRHSSPRKYHSMNECKAGARWKDGCKRCRCNKSGKPVCKSRHCNQSIDDKTGGNVLPSRRLPTSGLVSVSKPPFRMPDKPRFRIPSMHAGFRFNRKEKPVEKKTCNGFKPGDKYWDKCNLCRCTENGDPMCSSKLC